MSQKVHNEGLQHSSSPNLLSLPVSVRKSILHLALVETAPIVVSITVPEACCEPGLLFVCRDIRKDVLPIFYKANDFEIIIQSFDAHALLPWIKQAEALTKSQPNTADRKIEAQEPVRKVFEVVSGIDQELFLKNQFFYLANDGSDGKRQMLEYLVDYEKGLN